MAFHAKGYLYWLERHENAARTEFALRSEVELKASKSSYYYYHYYYYCYYYYYVYYYYYTLLL